MFGRQGTGAERLMGNLQYLCVVVMERDYLEMQMHRMHAPSQIGWPLLLPSFQICLINSVHGEFVVLKWGWVMFCNAACLLVMGNPMFTSEGSIPQSEMSRAHFLSSIDWVCLSELSTFETHVKTDKLWLAS